MLRTVAVATVRLPVRCPSPHLKTSPALQLRQLHLGSVLHKKRKKVLEGPWPAEGVMETKKEVLVITLDDDETQDGDVQMVGEFQPPPAEDPRTTTADRLCGKAIYHSSSPLSRRCLDFTWIGDKINKKGPDRGNVKFSILSYNVLAQELLMQHPNLYQNNNPNCLAWNTRFRGIMEEIGFLKPDIVCLQEVQATHLQSHYVKALRSLGYTGWFKQRTGDKCDGCAIFWKFGKISMLEQTSVEFFQPGVSILDRDNIALVLRLDIEGYQVIVATTHLLYNPKRSDVRLAQVQLLLAELDRLSHVKVGGEPRHNPVILTGDFNLNPFTSVYRLITAGQLKYDSLTKPRLMPKHGRSSPPLGRELVPPDLGVTDCCRHSSLIVERTETTQSSERNEAVITKEHELLKIYHSERKGVRKIDSSDNSSHQFGSGTLSHSLNLISAYLHRRNGYQEATTFQDKWDTVDYIFFSQLPPNKRNKTLSLLSTWRLPVAPECHQMGPIPNRDAPSDHLPLFANFLLS